MSRRPSPRGRAARLAFDALSIEGGLLSPAWLSKLAQFDAGMQAESDYRVPKGLSLRDEIARYWRVAQAYAREFDQGRARGGDPAALASRFVFGLLHDVFGFSSLVPSEALTREGRVFPVGHFALGTRVPVVIAPAGAGLDAPFAAFGEGGRKRSAFGLAQEFLNATDEALWGVVSDGVTLRVVRDNASLTRPAWIEADLARIFAEDRYADFGALWLLLHESRFGGPEQPPTDCALETWRNAGRDEGTRARDKLRGGVEQALVAFGQGFVAHPDNGALREALRTGALTPAGFYQELLRLAYRLIFLLTAEERAVLHAPDPDPAAVDRYARGYSLRRLRERAVRRSAHDRHHDLWDALRIVFAGVGVGQPRLALPALGGLFAAEQCPHLDAARLSNSHLLAGVFKLSWLHDEGAGLARVNWRDTGPEELGSVYESLLELVPQVDLDTRRFGFAQGDETRGNARKTSGSYYTPDSLVQVLLDSALEPVVADTLAAHPADPVEALLSLSVVDPACGSGHFLLAAARRLAAHVARLSARGSPSAAEYRHALRQVVARCIYGVDLNPMALELCRVSLWMEAVEPGRPLSFLDAHLQHGNALLGATPALMAKGVPDAAWEPIEGDDKKIASALKKKNKAERTGQGTLDTLWSTAPAADTASLASAVAALEHHPDHDLDAVRRKAAGWASLQTSDAARRTRFVADAWCAAFVWPKQPGAPEHAPTHRVWSDFAAGRAAPGDTTAHTVAALAAQHHFFHWHLAFPHVFARGGFDVVLGNPPWEHVELKEQEWFAERQPEIAQAANASKRKRLIEQLAHDQPTLLQEFQKAQRSVDAENQLIRCSGRFPLCAKGRINTYALFAEHNRAVLRPRGRAGFIVPTGIATDDTTKEYFGDLVANATLASFYSFENEEFVFPGVHHAFRFALLTLSRKSIEPAAELVFFARQVSALSTPGRSFSLAPEDFATLNPNTRTCPTFRSRRDADLNLTLYRRAGILWREDDPAGNPWGLRFMQGILNMASDSGLFRTRSDFGAAPLRGNRFITSEVEWLPLVEAKMVHLYDHRFGTYEAQSAGQANQGKLPELNDAAHEDPSCVTQPNYWVNRAEVDSRLDDRWSRDWLLGWRDICRSTDQRTVIASLIPRTATGDTFLLALPAHESGNVACLYANLCSFALDYYARQKVGGTHLKYHTFKQLPVLPPSAYAVEAPWDRALPLRDWLLPRVLELTYTAWDLEGFARDVGWSGPPFRWDPARRDHLRAELDAAFFHLYGIARDDADYILDTFPIVRKHDEKAHGSYRTKERILAAYDALAECSQTGRAYVSPLTPPPADPQVAHPPRDGTE